jgi:hypothetical protein
MNRSRRQGQQGRGPASASTRCVLSAIRERVAASVAALMFLCGPHRRLRSSHCTRRRQHRSARPSSQHWQAAAGGMSERRRCRPRRAAAGANAAAQERRPTVGRRPAGRRVLGATRLETALTTTAKLTGAPFWRTVTEGTEAFPRGAEGMECLHRWAERGARRTLVATSRIGVGPRALTAVLQSTVLRPQSGPGICRTPTGCQLRMTFQASLV